MKKLIALAVAAASMPAMAAVSVSGSYNVEYVDKTDKSAIGSRFATGATGLVTAANKSQSQVQSYDVDVAVSASAEMDNGMTISASLEADDSDNDGSVTISGAFGSIAMGDVAGALDAVDGAAAATARDDLSAGSGTDASVTYTLPTLTEGLTVKASFNAEDGGNGVENADATSVAVKYSNSGITFHAGQEDRNAADVTGYGASYSAMGFTVGYGYSEIDNDTGADSEVSAVAASYTVGNLTLAVNTQEKKSDDAGTVTTTSDITTMSVAYAMGGGVTAYASSSDNDVAQNVTTATATTTQSFEDVTRVGIKFAF